MQTIEPLVCVAESDIEFECMRRIRNTCLEFMTGDRARVSRGQQIAWVDSLDESRKPFVMYVEDNPLPVGYGLVLRHPTMNSASLSGGLLPDYRHRGLGRYLFLRMVEYCGEVHDAPYLEVFEDNLCAVRLYESIGFVRTGSHEVGMGTYDVGIHSFTRKKTVLTMEMTGDPTI